MTLYAPDLLGTLVFAITGLEVAGLMRGFAMIFVRE